jgi:microcystin-dependent protein
MGGEPYIGQLLLVGFNFAPVGWALCNGSSLSISDYGPLFQLIGTTFGGNGTTTFNVPDLRGRVPVHQGTGVGTGQYIWGQIGGAEGVTLTTSNYPSHNHSFMAYGQNSNANAPAGNAIAGGVPAFNTTTQDPGSGQLTNATIGPATGGSQPHENRQPYLAMNWIISLQGIYPTQS